ncbi:MAG: ATP-dependent DNA helicase RecG [Gammaproteobacteria bacterium]
MSAALPLHQTPVTALKGVSEKMAEKLARLNIFNLQDLLFHLPLRYEDRTRITPVGALQPGVSAQVRVTVELADVTFRRRRSLLVRVADSSGSMTLRFFHFSRNQQRQFTPGQQLICFGEPRRGANSLEFVHPEYRLSGSEPPALSDRLTPIYPATEGIQQRTLRKLTDQVLTQHLPQVDELLPPAVLADRHLPPLPQALSTLHRPTAEDSLSELVDGQHPARQRLALEELLAYHLSLLQRRRQRSTEQALTIGPSQWQKQFLQDLPFTPTQAQNRVISDISNDLANPHPMLRLLQGDVGSGKTVVAAAAALQAAEAGIQTALMAPTELLAEQHLNTLSAWLDNHDITLDWLTGRHKGKSRSARLTRLASGDIDIIVGTHALFQEEVAFNRLGLVIVDEQHRFGVHQRLSLREKGRSQRLLPHQLIMTATPIPRSLAMIFYADVETSIIDELPPGRQSITTAVLPDNRRDQVIERIATACKQGRQAYWVCPLIDESDTLQLQAASTTRDSLQAALPELTTGLIHGRLSGPEKERVMAEFSAGNIDLLVATTVIEVGVDVPNASLMIIENSERLGLAQLHQLRGRVGRGATASSCLLLYSGNISNAARSRLATIRETQDGFEIARRDLQLRGPGELLGTRQTGDLQLRIADISRDSELFDQVKQLATELEKTQPSTIELLIQRWLRGADNYIKV